MFFFIYVMLFSFKVTAAPLPFIAMAKHDPAALVDLLDTADPKAVSHIISLLEQMMTDNRGKIRVLNETLAAKEKALKAAELDSSDQAGKCGTIKSDLEKKEEAEKEALGVLTGAKATRADRDPKLQKELATLNTVLDKVKSLQKTSSEQTSRRLLAFDSVNMMSEIQQDPNAFIESLVDADPKKLQLVINLLEELIAAAQNELNHVIKVEEDAKVAHTKAVNAVRAARQLDGTCKKQLTEKQGSVAELTGERDVAKTARDTRTPILLSENATLQEIIDLLKPMAN